MGNPANKLRNSLASDHLNLIRGLAAIAVLVYHVRYRFFFDYADVGHPGLLQKSFYALTSFGHDAVMIFFVLSGYFISSSVIRDCRAGQWSWSKYLTSRFVRLYVVLLPGLILTLFWDKLGLYFFSSNPIYSGEPRPWHHDFFSVSARLDFSAITANLCFLQTILAPPLGSNEPLWSLSYEFWYYLLFPCAWLALFGKSVPWWKRGIYLALCGAGLLFVGKNIARYFPIWLLGTVIYLLPHVSLPARRSKMLSAAAVLFFCGMLSLMHLSAIKSALANSIVAMDYVTGASFALLLYQMLDNRAPSTRGRYADFSRTIAGFSYTLYVVHMPLLVFVRAAVLPDQPWYPDVGHMAAAAVLTLIALIYALLIARVSEARTDSFRDVIWAYLRPSNLAYQPAAQATEEGVLALTAMQKDRD